MLPEGWTIATISNLVEHSLRPEKVHGDQEYRMAGVRLNANGPYLREIKTGSEIKATRLFRLEEGDFIYNKLFAGEGAFGVVNEVLAGAHVSNEFPVFICKPEILDNRFLRHHFSLSAVIEAVRLACVGTTASRSRWHEKKFLSYQLALPPLVEQHRIVAVLEQTDRAVEAAARHAADANRLFAAARGQAATIARDADRRSEICHFAKVTKGSSPTMRTGPGTYPFVVTAEEPRTAPQWQIEGPAVCVPLISSTGHGHASIKRLHLAHDKFALANLLAAIHQINGSVMIPSFLYHLLTHLKDELLVPLMSGTANVTMSVSSLERLVVPIPPLAEQQAIVARIEKVEAAVRAAETHLARLRALRSSLLENLVSGRVRLPMPDATASEVTA